MKLWDQLTQEMANSTAKIKLKKNYIEKSIFFLVNVQKSVVHFSPVNCRSDIVSFCSTLWPHIDSNSIRAARDYGQMHHFSISINKSCTYHLMMNPPFHSSNPLWSVSSSPSWHRQRRHRRRRCLMNRFFVLLTFVCCWLFAMMYDWRMLSMVWHFSRCQPHLMLLL